MSNETTVETGAGIVAKLTPSVSVTAATIAGYPVSDLVLWVTLFYTVILAGHKLWQIVKEVRGVRDDNPDRD